MEILKGPAFSTSDVNFCDTVPLGPNFWAMLFLLSSDCFNDKKKHASRRVAKGSLRHYLGNLYGTYTQMYIEKGTSIYVCICSNLHGICTVFAHRQALPAYSTATEPGRDLNQIQCTYCTYIYVVGCRGFKNLPAPPVRVFEYEYTCII